MCDVSPDGAEFLDPGVVEAYRFRPPIPDEVFDHLVALIPAECRTVLDAGCGVGAVASRLADHADRIDAVDPSEAMITAARNSTRADNIRWIVGTMEDAPIQPPYGLIVCAGSLHWMDLEVVMPRFADALHVDGLLAIVSQYEAPTPWAQDLDRLIAEHSSNQDQHRYGLFPRIVDDGFYRPVRYLRTKPVTTRQSISDYLESLHSRSGLARDRMADPAEFDAALAALLARHAVDRLITFDVIGQLSWGTVAKPLRAGR